MKRMKLVGLALLAVLAIGGSATASASASGCYCWKVSGSKLESGKNEAIKAEATRSYVVTGKALGFIEIALTCDKARASGELIGGQPGKTEATIQYSGCKSNSGLCTPEEPIETRVKSEIVLLTVGGDPFWGDLFSAKEASGIFTTITCTGGLKAEFTGDVVGFLLNEGKEKVEVGKESLGKKGYLDFAGAASTKSDKFSGTETTDELLWEGTTATLEGTSEITLTSGKAYGVY
jgi:hypothetical protein